MTDDHRDDTATADRTAGEEPQALLDRLLAEADPDARFDDIPPAPRGRPLPLSFPQRRLWFLDRMGVAGNAYTIPMNMRLDGPLDVAALERAIGAVLERHEALRTVFRDADGEPVQEVVAWEPRRLPVTDLSGLDAEAREAEAAARVEAADRAAFSLATGPLLRAGLLRLGPESHVLLLAVHHIAFDGWSVGIFLGELSAHYRAFRSGRPLRLPPLEVQYADFAAWQAGIFGREGASAELDFWRRRLAGAKPLELPADRPRPPVLGFRGGRVDFHLPRGPWSAYEAEARRQGATPYMALLAAFAMLAARLTGETHVAVGTPVAGRDRAEIEPLIGFFVNSVVMATDLSGRPTVSEALARVRDAALDAFDHAQVPFERLVEELQPERSLDRNPLFQVMVALHQNEAMAPDIDLDGLAATPIPFAEMTARFDLEIHSWIEDGSPKGICTYNLDLFEGASVERLIARLGRLIESAGEDPGRRIDRLDYLPERERAELAAWNDTARPWSEEPLHRGFERAARSAPDRPALVFADRTVTLGRLDSRADAIARRLVAAGVGRGDVVSLCLDRGDGLIAAFLGVFKAGACYLPVDPAEPLERLAHILSDSRAVLHLTERRHAALFAAAPARPDGSAAPVLLVDGTEEEGRTGDPVFVPTGPDDLAYIIYTSGSTGRPKGIEGRHGTIANLVEWHVRHHPGPPLRTLQYAQVSFDIFFQELFTSWFTGAACWMVDEATRQDMHALAEFIRRHRLERIFLPFAPLQYLVDVLADAELPDLRQVFTAGEQLQATPAVVAWFARRPQVSFHNHYGPTECYVVTAHDLPADPTTWPALPPVGLPVDNVRITVVDDDFRPLPVGVAGEILIGGVQISRGYRGRPDLTAEKFVPDPFALRPGARAYRTGDLGVRRADGAIQFLGRMDRQLKIRGFRVEPGEIEVALVRHPAVAQALVTTFRAAGGDVRLVAYVVPRPEVGAGERANLPRSLKASLDGVLPDHMVPAAFMILDALPMTVAGKISRLALPDPSGAVDAEAAPAIRAAGPVEAALADIFADLLGRDRVGLDEDFFDLGGHSLLGSRLVSRVRTALGVELPLSRLFEAPTAAGLAAHVEGARGTGEGETAPAIEARGANRAPASFAQRRLWLMDRMGTTGAAYLMPVNLALAGPLDTAALERALSRIVERHPALRTVFRDVDGEPEQVVLPPAALPLDLLDLTDHAADEATSILSEAVSVMGTRPFDLAADPPFRALLVRLAPEEHRLLAAFHHIASDGWSIAIFFAELGALYSAFAAGRPDPLPALPFAYADFASWQRRTIAGARRDRLLAYWKPLLEDLAPLALPTDRPRRAGDRYAGDGFRFALPADLTAGIRRLARQGGATLYTTLLAAYMALLHRLSGEDRIAVGSPVANRNRGETEGMIGFFVNALVLTAEVDAAAPWRSLLGQVRERVLGAFDHQDMPFEALVEALRPARDVSRNPLFQVLLALQQPEAMAARPALDGLAVEALELGRVTARFDLETHLWLDGDRLEGLVTYDADLFDRETVAGFMDCFRHLLADVVADPDRPVGRLATASPEARAAARALAATARLPVFPAGLLHERVFARLADDPDRVVVSDAGGAWTAADLAREARAVAARLAARGLAPGEPVLVLVGRDRRAVAALLGVLAAGGAYVPIDPRHPADRIAFVAGDCSARFALVDATTERLLAEGAAEPVRMDVTEPGIGDAATPILSDDATAYVIYTSGSTGRPKGVVVSHANATRLFTATAETFRFSPADVWTCTHSLAFDFSVWEIWGPLLTGGRLVMVESETARSPEALTDLILAEGVTVLSQTPSAFQALAPAVLARPALDTLPLRWVVFGGEALGVPSLAPWFDRFGDTAPRLVNCYGITETTVHVTMRPLGRTDCAATVASPIGAAIPDLALSILDAGLEPVAEGVVGEICVAGAGVAKGYLGRPELDAERFVADPAGGVGRLYRSGDLARRRRDGEIEYLGRLDAQVKLRGHRIEPGEIAAALRADPRVADAAVLLRRAPGGDPRLVAWVVPAAAREDGPDTGEAEQVERWRRVFEERYVEADPVSDDPRLKLTGWTSVYDREPIPAATMRAWADDTAAAILRFRPRRILEIGCGTGILLFRLAPAVERYVGIDPAASALAHVRATVATVAGDCAHAELLRLAADGLDALGAETFDTVVINSVAQYLPSAAHLARVLEAAAGRLAPGGRIVLGDLRDLRLVEAFHADVQVARADPATPAATLASETRRAVAQESELLVAPDFLRALAARLPAIRSVGFLAQRGPAGELSTFRYTAVLAAADPPVPALPVVAAGERDLADLEALLADGSGGLVVTGIRNARPARALARAAALAAGRPVTAGEVAAIPAPPGIDPEALAAVAARHGLATTFAPSPADPARFDAVMTTGPAAPLVPASRIAGDPARHANDPLGLARLAEALPAIRAGLAARLPDYMVPAHLVPVPALPLTVNGKLDVRALPDPWSETAGDAAGPVREPATETEAALVELFRQLLGVERVGTDEDFFALGGHSLLATSLCSRVRGRFGVELPLLAVFRTPTVVALAEAVDTLLWAARGSAAEPGGGREGWEEGEI